MRWLSLLHALDVLQQRIDGHRASRRNASARNPSRLRANRSRAALSSWPSERNQACGGITEPVPERLEVGLAADKGGRSEGQRHADEFVHRCVVGRCARAPNERVTCRTGQVECCGERTHGFDVRAPSFPALQRADAMYR